MATNYNPKVVTNGLILYLDAGNERSYPGTGTVWTDLTRNNYNGTLTNGPVFNGANGGSIVFDGINDYVTCGSVYNFGGSNSAGTILIWARGKDNMFSNQRPGVSNTQHGWIDIAIESNRYYLYIDAYNNPPYGEFFIIPLSATGYNSLSGEWRFYSVSINRPTNTYTVGIDDKIFTYNKTFTVENFFNFNTIEIARMNNSTYFTRYFTGNIASVAVYNRAITREEILQNYNATKGRFGL